MHVNRNKAISADARWREDQEWFVAMTFNSYMMLFAFFWLNEPFKMFKKQKKNGFKLLLTKQDSLLNSKRIAHLDTTTTREKLTKLRKIILMEAVLLNSFLE